MNLLRRSIIALTLLSLPLLSDPASAQTRTLELRLDFASAQFNEGTVIDLAFPGSFALAIYMSQQFAVEPSVSVSYFSEEGSSATFFRAGFAFPFYFKADEGRTGAFVAPAVTLSKVSGDFSSDALFDYGLDVGFKAAAQERVSTRLALTLRDGDTHEKAVLGLTFGVGFFWK